MDAMEGDKIVLDRKSFEALAVESRVKILKALKVRRKTLTEISEELSMSVSAVKEHLENLEAVDLVVKKDEGHKWKYYELTKKGAEIVGPKELRVWIILSISIIALAASLLAMFSPPPFYSMTTGGMNAAPQAGEAPIPTGAAPPSTDNIETQNNALTAAPSALAKTLGNESSLALNGGPGADTSGVGANDNGLGASDNGTREMATNASQASGANQPDLKIPLIVAIISGLTLLGCLAILYKNRKPGAQSG